mmetsp:Transcript_51082/g.159612  ORF Transcript_51082/g.159612 Transcript_51082/m.159612 type:complete len:262 (+) Transcript_51082:1557-2342(+)
MVIQAPLSDRRAGDLVLADGLEEEAGSCTGVKGLRQAVERHQDDCKGVRNLPDALDHLRVCAADVSAQHHLRVCAGEDVGLDHREHHHGSGAVVVLNALEHILRMALEQRKHELEVPPALLWERLVHDIHHLGHARPQLEDRALARDRFLQGAGGPVEIQDIHELERVDQPIENFLGLVHQRRHVPVQHASREEHKEPHEVVGTFEVSRGVAQRHLHPGTQAQGRAVDRAVQVEDHPRAVSPGVRVDEAGPCVPDVDVLEG